MTVRFDREVSLGIKAALAYARRLGADEMGGEHLLVGLSAVPSPAASALTEFGVDAAGMEEAVSRGTHDARLLAGLGIDLAAVQRRAGVSLAARRRARRPRFRTDTRQAIEASLVQSRITGTKRIHSTHLLLGLLDTSVAARELLLALDVDVPKLRRTVVHTLTDGG